MLGKGQGLFYKKSFVDCTVPGTVPVDESAVRLLKVPGTVPVDESAVRLLNEGGQVDVGESP